MKMRELTQLPVRPISRIGWWRKIGGKGASNNTSRFRTPYNYQLRVPYNKKTVLGERRKKERLCLLLAHSRASTSFRLTTSALFSV